MAAVTGTDGDENNTGLNEYGEDVRTGYDIRTAGEGEGDDAETDSEADVDSGDGEADVDSDDGEADSEGELAGEPLAPAIVHYVREECRGGDDAPHEDLVENLRDRGAAEKTVDYWIDKCVEEGDIIEPDDGFYRR
jgi:DNA replicative helicase MCM subunit Mcm2 (Cdc46/Mcm family)